LTHVAVASHLKLLPLGSHVPVSRCPAPGWNFKGRNAEGYDIEDTTDSEPVSDREPTGEPRQPPSPHLRKLPEGQSASEEKKAEYKALTGDDLSPGVTFVNGGFHPTDSLEDEGPGEAAA
ncbi:hypothetical protein, partial [Kitasatospora sp. NPDC047058]|uniref:hypothetical protein n=1 Tax=Kitasatospora sp. NPDC047058 TaxID=3155620 RepID=UPI0033C0ABFC